MSTNPEQLASLTHRDAAWAGLRVLVAGLGVSGFAAADALLDKGAHVIVVDGADLDGAPAIAERARILEILDADVRCGSTHIERMPPDPVDLVVTSPGWAPHQPLLAEAARLGIPIWGEVELAWRMQPSDGAAPWLTVTGTNGKTTTVEMLTAILRAAGKRVMCAGNVGTPILEAVMDPQGFDVIVVELSSFQLHWSDSLAPLASACLNVAPDHLQWHGDYATYLAAKGKVYSRTEIACVYNVQDPQTEQLVRDAEVQEGCRAIGFTLGTPAPSMVGVVEDVLADRAFIADRQRSAAELGTLSDLTSGGGTLAPHTVANALAAAALARAFGVPPAAVQAGLRAFEAVPHRLSLVAEAKGVQWINDSKATNAHAAGAALHGFAQVVWVAGGLVRGSGIDELVAEHAGRLRGVVLIGADRDVFADSLARHAPDVPVVSVDEPETGVMDRVVAEAGALAREGDVVLLAPAAASLDMFANYGVRGEAFSQAVRRHLAGE